MRSEENKYLKLVDFSITIIILHTQGLWDNVEGKL